MIKNTTLEYGQRAMAGTSYYRKCVAYLTWHLTLLEGMRHKFPNSTKYLISVQISNCLMFYCWSTCFLQFVQTITQPKVHTLCWSVHFKCFLIYSHSLHPTPTARLPTSFLKFICWRNEVICHIKFPTVWVCWLNPCVTNMFSCLVFPINWTLDLI